MTEASSLIEAAYRSLRRQLITCAIRPGEKLKIAHLSEQLQVSPGAVREALSRLDAEGLVTLRPQYGFRAREASSEELRSLTLVRLQIETECVMRSIEHGDLSWELGLVSAHRTLQNALSASLEDCDREECNAADTAFFDALVAGCTCNWMLELRRTLGGQAQRYAYYGAVVPSPDQAIEYTTLMTAALARDVAKAVELTTALQRQISQRCQAVLMTAPAPSNSTSKSTKDGAVEASL